MPVDPETDDFLRATQLLTTHPLLEPHISGDEVHLRGLTLEDIHVLAKNETAYYFLIAAAGLNRTSIKRALTEPATTIVQKSKRRAFVIKDSLPKKVSFQSTLRQSVGLRSADLGRRRRASVESLFRERIAAEGIRLSMSPPVRKVPGVLVGKRKPDGVYPDPATKQRPRLYLEIKSIRRVSDDIQKRLYEIAEASIEMKTLYGDLQLKGFELESTEGVESNPELQDQLRAQITASPPVVVAFFICSRKEAERYRRGAQAFLDRIFFQEEVEECLQFLRETIERFEVEDSFNKTSSKKIRRRRGGRS